MSLQFASDVPSAHGPANLAIVVRAAALNRETSVHDSVHRKFRVYCPDQRSTFAAHHTIRHPRHGDHGLARQAQS